MKVIGLDLSLAATGLVDAAAGATHVLKPRKQTGLARIRWIRAQVLLHAADADLVVIEGPSYGSHSAAEKGHHERAGLWWVIYDALDNAGLQVAVVTPTALKKYATGVGNAAKDQVLVAACRRFDWFKGSNDEADALWLSVIGYDLAGASVIERTDKQREVLVKVEWPQAA